MSSSLSDILRRATERLDVPDVEPGVATAVRARHHRQAEKRRRRRVGIGLSAAVVLGVAGGAAVGGDRDDFRVSPNTSADPPPDTLGTGSTSTDASSPDEPSSVPEPPLRSRSHAAVVVFESGDIFVWGGETPNGQYDSELPLDDGAYWSASRGQWRAIAADDRFGGLMVQAFAAPDGSAVVVGHRGAIGRYDPTGDGWTVVAPAQCAEDFCAVQSTMVGGETVYFPELGVAIDTASGHETRITPPEVWPRDATTIELDNELVVYGSLDDAGSSGLLVAYDPATDRWRSLPIPSVTEGWDGWYEGFGVVDGQLVVANWEWMQVSVFDPATGSWSAMPGLPQRLAKCRPEIVDVRGALVVEMCGTMQLWLEAESRWAPFDTPRTWRYDGPLAYSTVLHVDTEGVLFSAGAVIDTRQARWWERPLTVEGLTVQPSLQATWTVSTYLEDPAVPFEMTSGTVTGCTLSVSGTGPTTQRVVQRDAMAAAESSPPDVRWGSDAASYRLACPDAAAYRVTFAGLATRGERTQAVDITADVGGDDVVIIGFEDLESLARSSALAHARLDDRSAEVAWIGLRVGDGPPVIDGVPIVGQPPVIEVGIPSPQDPLGPERLYRFITVSSDGAFRLDRVELQYVCATPVEPGAVACPA